MTETVPPLTPTRRLGTLDDAGVRHIGHPEITAGEGVEERLLEIVGQVDDRSSLSDELHWSATDWTTRLSLSRSRANVLRGLDLPADATVLEVGAGCGPISRYLAETCALLDTVEAHPDRARVARARTADLPGVQVMVGRLEDVAPEPVYDVVVAVGGLEQVGAGDDGDDVRARYVAFLREVERRLKLGGTLVVAMENALGVRYLAGSPEEHSHRVFDSLESYPTGGPARAFSRPELHGLLQDAGLTVTRTLGAFPDHRMPRVVIADELYDEAPSLGWRLPSFPSPERVVRRPRLVSEGRLWRRLVTARLGPDMPNSFIALAHKGEPTADLWPSGRLARVWTSERKRAYASMITVESGSDAPTVSRRPMDESSGVDDAPLAMSEAFVDEVDVVELLADRPDLAETVLAAWGALLLGRDRAPMDLVPHNLLRSADGTLHVIDQEWGEEDVEVVRRRGAYQLAYRLSGRSIPDAWAVDTLGDLVDLFWRQAGGEGASPDWTAFAEDEAARLVHYEGPDTPAELAAVQAAIAGQLASPFPLSELARRHLDPEDEQVLELVARASHYEARATHYEAAANERLVHIQELFERVDTLRAKLSRMRRTLAQQRAQAAEAQAELEHARRRVAQVRRVVPTPFVRLARGSASTLRSITGRVQP